MAERARLQMEADDLAAVEAEPTEDGGRVDGEEAVKEDAPPKSPSKEQCLPK